jgi:pSer/pThr/pTyr-binding forkhead associated (FHA) protein
VDALFGHDRTAALAGFELVLKVQPANKLAQRLRARALALPKKGMPVLLKIGVGLFGLVSSGGFVHLGVPRLRGRSRRPRRSKPVDAQLPMLVVQYGPSAGRRFPIASQMVIGRDGADMALDDPGVSRDHAAIRPVGHGLEIEDLGSANGTSVNGTTIDGPQSLSDGDVVQVGNTRLAVHIPARRGDATVFADRTPPARLVVNGGPFVGESHPVATETLIGRCDADFVLDDAQVSRRHAVVRWSGGGLTLEDLGSTNGTSVNGVRIDGPQRLEDGDAITIGPFAINVHIVESREADPRATVVAD